MLSMGTPYQDNAFWFSKLSDARRCLRYYKHKHIDKLPCSDPSLDMEFGTAYHLAVNEILSEEGDGQETFKTYWESVNQDMRKTRFGWDALMRMGPEMIRKFREMHARHFKPILMEERLYGTVGTHQFEGTPDFYGTFKGQLAVFDFKTSGYNYVPERIVTGEQLPGYAHLLEQNGHRRPEIIGFSVAVKDFAAPKIQRAITTELTTELQRNTILNVVETCDDLATRKTWPKNPANCAGPGGRCAFYDRCFGGSKNEGE